MKIKNITIKKYLELDYTFQYDLVYDLLKSKNLFNGKICDYKNLTFDEVTVMKKIIVNPSVDAMVMLFDICYKETDFFNCKVIDFFQAKKWIDEFMIKLMEREKTMLYVPPDPRQIKAGSEKLVKFGVLNTKKRLGEQFGFRPREIGEWTYTEVLHLQAINVTTDNVLKNIK